MDLSLNQKAVQLAPEWWQWEVFLDGPDSDLDQVASVEYLLHPTFSEPRPRRTDRASRFAVRSEAWGEFMVYAEVQLRIGEPIHLRHWLRLQAPARGDSCTMLLVGSPGDEAFTDELQTRLENCGFTVHRIVDTASLRDATVAVALLSAGTNPWLEKDLEQFAEAHKTVLTVGFDDVEPPPCLAHYRCPPDAATRLRNTEQWLVQVLDRSDFPFTGDTIPPVPSAFWSRRLALASFDLQRATASMFPLAADGVVRCTAVAVAPDRLIAPLEVLMDATSFSINGVSIQPLPNQGKDVMAFEYPVPNGSFIPLSQTAPLDPAIGVVRCDESTVPQTDRGYRLSFGWLCSPPGQEIAHDVPNVASGAAIVSLETGDLLGLQLRPQRMVSAASIRRALGEAVGDETRPAELESRGGAEDAAFLERRANAEDYADRNGYDTDFLGISVPLPKTSAESTVLRYRNFSVAMHRQRQLALYAVVNIDGKHVVEEHRSGDPWQLDPRLAGDLQVGQSYYAGTPLDRGHMVRRIDPVWGDNFKQAELDTFHYPNSCPQHKNLNRKTWNDLEDYIYFHLKSDKQRVTVFTGPVLAADDPVFHGRKLPREFWKIIAFRLPDGNLSATAYILSQEDMIRGLEFVFGEFRTYQVPVALIEKKTRLDFGSLRKHDPKARSRGMLEGAAPSEIRGAADLDIGDVDAGPATGARGITGPAWRDKLDFQTQFDAALETFDWKTVDTLVESLVMRLGQGTTELDPAFANRTLMRLQRKRRFGAMTRAGEAFLHAGFRGPQVRRRYAQALIDQGVFQAAALVLQGIVSDDKAPPAEQEEAQGLLGRISKQIYTNLNCPGNPRNVASLQEAVDTYFLSYSVNPAKNYWHGINVAACLLRAERDGIRLRFTSDPRQILQDILDNMLRREEQSTSGELNAYEQATCMEACIGLGDFDSALQRAKMFAGSKDADAFEFASCLRQLEEVWQLRSDSEPGSLILPELRAALLSRSGGSLQVSPSAAQSNLQKVFGADGSLALEWYQLGLRRAESVVRIETNQKGYGTGWLLDIGKLVPGKPNRTLLITNAHVIGPDTSDRYPGALTPEQATVNFLMLNQKVPAGKVIFHSPVNQLDATLLELPELPAGVTPLEIDVQPIRVEEKDPSRLYMIGCPAGRSLEFSLHDNFLLAANQRLVHYRTPSEPGSSGSPVFGPTDWRVVALHHAGSREMPCLDRSGTYEANEGIALGALAKWIAEASSKS
ncbi:MAG: DNA/RNA non-specific endonuclease [Bryobacteraceae bacterium]|nr:DNA/RNA non-specific endonuclease [Bryobacteraceae bacterium]